MIVFSIWDIIGIAFWILVILAFIFVCIISSISIKDKIHNIFGRNKANKEKEKKNETVEHNGKTYTYIEEPGSSMSVEVCAKIFIDRCRGLGLYCTRMNGTMIYSDETFGQFNKRWKEERGICTRHHTCGSCKYDTVPEKDAPCVNCIYSIDMRKDLWQPKGE